MPLATTTAPSPTVVLDADVWRAREQAHAERADALTAGHRDRAARGERHPIEDFLFTYYSYSPACCGAGTRAPASNWRMPRTRPAPSGAGMQPARRPRLAHRRPRRHRAREGAVARRRRADPAATRGAPGAFGCFGLHEWAMVYRQAEHRHPVPLRLGQVGDRRPSSRRTSCAARTSTRSASSRPRRRRATDSRRPARRSPSSSSPAACTPAWTCTSGR